MVPSSITDLVSCYVEFDQLLWTFHRIVRGWSSPVPVAAHIADIIIIINLVWTGIAQRV